MRRFVIEYTNKPPAEVLLMPHKDGSGWSFVNLTKGHICPCVFKSEAAAIADLITTVANLDHYIELKTLTWDNIDLITEE